MVQTQMPVLEHSEIRESAQKIFMIKIIEIPSSELESEDIEN
jgi:hypothetical protein